MCASERRSATDCLRCLLLSSDDTPTQQIRQVVQCGNTMYAAGSFWDIMQGGTTYTRHNVSSFSATVPCTITGWVPGVEGTYGTTSDASDTLNTIGFVNGNCADAYIGGKFTSVERHDRAEHRRDQHYYRQRGQHVRQQGLWRRPSSAWATTCWWAAFSLLQNGVSPVS